MRWWRELIGRFIAGLVGTSVLVYAAVFGLTPNLLSKRLEQQAERFKDDLRSTEASGTTSASAPPS